MAMEINKRIERSVGHRFRSPSHKAAEGATAFGASLNISGANLGIGLGAIVGGRVMTSWGLESVGYAAACFIGLAIALAVLMMIRPAPQAVVCDHFKHSFARNNPLQVGFPGS
ncbi:hypothetical protein CFN58_33415 [Pseudomonas avellanae]|uniref:Major facilitator family transporter n=1 Tax=Pseudomonas avellanae TaxID=46257 RepID=A0A261WAE1_9PSED|nr:hypothetical protein [Pseudomonas syringae]OZI83148.1 hypothetical protein CFN58_33415 [Pseudomonas avellanae]GAO94259.1 hypothetical protein PSA5_16100 [Pseudomonas syringae pv. actinidiae]